MLDSKLYPSAYINYKNLRIEFNEAKLKGNRLDAQVVIKVDDGK